jgi:hypothetical protein
MGRRWLALKKTLSALIVHRRATAAGIVHRDIELLHRVCIWTRRCDTATSAEGESKDDSSSGVGWLNDRLQRRQPESAENLVTGRPGDPAHSREPSRGLRPRRCPARTGARLACVAVSPESYVTVRKNVRVNARRWHPYRHFAPVVSATPLALRVNVAHPPLRAEGRSRCTIHPTR